MQDKPEQHDHRLEPGVNRSAYGCLVHPELGADDTRALGPFLCDVTKLQSDVRGYKDEGTITTASDMIVPSDLDRFDLGVDTVDWAPETGEKGIARKEQFQEQLIEHKRYIDGNGHDLPDFRDWRWES